MAFSLLQVESKVQFSPLPNQDIEQGHQDKTDIEERSESSWNFVAAALRLIITGMLLFVIAIYVKQLEEHSDPIQPKFFVNSLRVSSFNISDGKLSASWDVKLYIINIMNDTDIRIGTMEAVLMYEEDEILAEANPVEAYDLYEDEGFLMEANQEQRLSFEFRTTEWEKEQPIVDDTVIEDIAGDWKRGMISFSIMLRLKGDFEFEEWVVPFVMYPSCNDLVVHFQTASTADVAANLINNETRECSNVMEYGYIRSVL